MDPKIEEIKNTAKQKAENIISAVKHAPKAFLVGLGAGVLITGPFPGGLTVAIVGAGLLVGSMFLNK